MIPLHRRQSGPASGLEGEAVDSPVVVDPKTDFRHFRHFPVQKGDRCFDVIELWLFGHRIGGAIGVPGDEEKGGAVFGSTDGDPFQDGRDGGGRVLIGQNLVGPGDGDAVHPCVAETAGDVLQKRGLDPAVHAVK